MSHDIFICYSARDKTIADAMCAVLESEGVRCWIAPRDILPGADWGECIIDAINDAKAMVLVFSSNANQAQSQIKREVERAVNKGIPVIPFRIENVMPTKSLEYFLSTPHWLDAFTPPLDEHVRQLADSIKRLLGKQAAPRPALQPQAAPTMPSLPHHGHMPGMKEVRADGVSLVEWAKQPLHAGILAGAAILLAAGLWWVFRPTATPEDQQAWNIAAMEDSVPAYQLYLREEPKGYYRSQAGDRVAELKTEVDTAFAKAKAANTAAAYQNFLNTYTKQGIDIDEARDAYANADAQANAVRNAYRRATATRTKDGYQAFMADYGTSSYAADVRQRLAACRTETQKSGGTQSSEIERSATGSGGSPTEACTTARESATNKIDDACSKTQGRMGAIRIVSQNPQQSQSSAGRQAVGSLLGGALFGNGQSINMGSNYECSTEVEVSCEKTVSTSRQVDVCP